jgi:hypothetical protein
MAMITLCFGMDRPRTVRDVMRSRMGDTYWQGQLDVQIPVRRAGIAQWIVWVDGTDVRAVHLDKPSIMPEGATATADIRGKKRPRLIGI